MGKVLFSYEILTTTSIKNLSASDKIINLVGHNLYGFEGAANPFCNSGLMEFARRMVDQAGSTNIGGKVLLDKLSILYVLRNVWGLSYFMQLR